MLNRVSHLFVTGLILSPLFSHVDSQQSAMSSIDWQFQKTYQNLHDYENRVKADASSVLISVNNLMDDLKSNPNVSFMYQTLSAIARLLINIVSLNEYKGTQTGKTCSFIGQRMGTIGSDNEKLAGIRANIDIDAALVDTYAAVLYSAIYVNYYQLTTTGKFCAVSIKNRMNVLTLNLRHYANLLSVSINNINILYSKWNTATTDTCSDCPVTTNFGSSDKALAVIDPTVQSLESTLAAQEILLNQMSVITVNLIKSILSNIKNVSTLLDLSSSLDSCMVLVMGLKDLNTNDLWNETANCADKAWRSSVIEFKRLQFIVLYNEAQYNLTILGSSSAIMNSFYLASNNILNSTQKTTISNIITNINSISDSLQKYIVNLGYDYGALFSAGNELFANSNIIACNCPGVNWVTSTSVPPSTFAPISSSSSSTPATFISTRTTMRTTSALPSTSTTTISTSSTGLPTLTTSTLSTSTQASTYTDNTEMTTDYTMTSSTDYETTNSTEYGTYSDTEYTQPVERGKTFSTVGAMLRTVNPQINKTTKLIRKRSVEKCINDVETRILWVDENLKKTKSACMVNKFLNQKDARRYCSIFHMKLFMIDSDQTQTNLFEFLNSTESSFAIFIDGTRNSTDGKWYYEQGKVEAFAGLKWKNLNKTNDRGEIALVVVKSGNEYPSVDAFSEKNYLNFICEFNDV